MAASVAAEEGSVMYPDPGNAGQYTIADATAGGHFGVLRTTISTTDADYATTKTVKIEVPAEAGVEWKFIVGSGTFTAEDVGKYADLADEKTVAVDVVTKKHLLITKFVSAIEGRCEFAGNAGIGQALAATS